VFFEDPRENFERRIARSADLVNKPFLHSVVKLKGEFQHNNDDIDVTFNILCRDLKGKRLKSFDLELEIYKSNNELILVVNKLNYPDEPILWSGSKNLWMDSKVGKKCIAPNYAFKLENLANRIKILFD